MSDAQNASGRLIEIIVTASIPAPRFKDPRFNHLFVSSSVQPKLESRIVISDNGVSWIVTEVRGNDYGWTLQTLKGLVDRGSIRLFIDGVEQDDISGL